MVSPRAFHACLDASGDVVVWNERSSRLRSSQRVLVSLKHLRRSVQLTCTEVSNARAGAADRAGGESRSCTGVPEVQSFLAHQYETSRAPVLQNASDSLVTEQAERFGACIGFNVAGSPGHEEFGGCEA